MLGVGTVLLWPVLVPSAVRSGSVECAQPGRNGISKLQELADLMSALNPSAVDADGLPNAFGAFGLSVANPIPTRSILESRKYLERLRSADGARVTYERIGSVTSEISEWPIDVYRVTCTKGLELGTLYFSPYHRRTSARVPRGFGLFDRQTGQTLFNPASVANPVEPSTACRLAEIGSELSREDLADRSRSAAHPQSAMKRGEAAGSNVPEAGSESRPRQVLGPALNGTRQAGLRSSGTPFAGSGDIAELRASAEEGNPESQYTLGLRYIYGHGVGRSAVLGERWLSRAAQSGYAEAQFSLGVLHWDGLLLEHGIQQARHWLELAAAQGHSRASSMLPIVRKRCSTRNDDGSKASPAHDDRSSTATAQETSGEATSTQNEEVRFAKPETVPKFLDLTEDGYGRANSPIVPLGEYLSSGKPKSEIKPSKPARSGFQDGALRQDCSIQFARERPRAASFESTTSWKRTDKINQRFFRSGINRGQQCVELAEQALFKDPTYCLDIMDQCDRLQEISREIAATRGYTLVGEVAGMGNSIDGSDPLFDERRAAFIEGVLEGIDGQYDGDN